MDPLCVARRALAATGVIATPSACLDDMRLERDVLTNDSLHAALCAELSPHRTLFPTTLSPLLRSNSTEVQKWPGVNAVRHLVGLLGYAMKPGKRAAGYRNGQKMYRRFYTLCPKQKKNRGGPDKAAIAHQTARAVVDAIITQVVAHVIDIKQGPM